MLSFSFYLFQPFEQIEEAFRKAVSLGARELFTSLHLLKGKELGEQEKLKWIGRFARRYGVGVVADATPAVLSYLSASPDVAKALREWGMVGLRLDDGFSWDETVQLSKQMKVVLNASTITEREIQELTLRKIDWAGVEAWHNFYPRPETGLSGDTLMKQNRMLRQFGIASIGAFVPGNAQKRGPLCKGLPTLEDHREADPVYAYIELIETYKVEKVFVGDLSVSDDVLRRMVWVPQEIIPIRYQPIVSARWLSLVETVHTNRRDAARDVIRSAESRRTFAWPQEALHPIEPAPRPIGSVTIDNERYGRYAGELQITLTDLPADDNVNVIGRVISEDVPLLRHIQGGRPFCLIRCY
ncbi:MupG family TIM beta-alpha barrel fold protein [Geobacillus thermocatenulatus]|uniref:MupG family TIM beta-alpha barrel fold protein n=1 Tax=Geobacillus thermocatenulatus TaxID=33938 RepID=UPI0004733F79|nr:MupG family TIM beta-alpha barrel fold protein [Geobacillus thermocatenulatus]